MRVEIGEAAMVSSSRFFCLEELAHATQALASAGYAPM
jgi:hypothetical protein